MGALALNGLQQPPECHSNLTDCPMDTTDLRAYAILAAASVVFCLICVSACTVSVIWLALHRNDEVVCHGGWEREGWGGGGMRMRAEV